MGVLGMHVSLCTQVEDVALRVSLTLDRELGAGAALPLFSGCLSSLEFVVTSVNGASCENPSTLSRPQLVPRRSCHFISQTFPRRAGPSVPDTALGVHRLWSDCT